MPVSMRVEILRTVKAMAYLSHDTAVKVSGNGPGDVYLLQSTDIFSHALCFHFAQTDEVYTLEFTVEDARGVIACLLPKLVDEEGRLHWPGSAISMQSELGNGWRASTTLGKVSVDKFMAYQRWLLSWLEENQHYSIIDGGSTVKKFVVDSLVYLGITSPLVPLRIDVYSLSYAARERCDPGEMFTVCNWFASLEDPPKSIHSAVAWLSRQESIYFHEGSTWGSRYWKITEPKFTLRSEPILLPVKAQSFSLPSFSSSLLPSPPTLPSSPPPHNSLFAAGPRTVTTATQTVGAGSGFVTTSGSVAPAPLVVPSETSTTLIAVIILVVILIIVLFLVIVYYASQRATTPTQMESVTVHTLTPGGR